MNVLSAYKRVYHMYNSAGGIQKKGIRSPGNRVTGGCELPCECKVAGALNP